MYTCMGFKVREGEVTVMEGQVAHLTSHFAKWRPIFSPSHFVFVFFSDFCFDSRLNVWLFFCFDSRLNFCFDSQIDFCFESRLNFCLNFCLEFWLHFFLSNYYFFLAHLSLFRMTIMTTMTTTTLSIMLRQCNLQYGKTQAMPASEQVL